jgi:clan AA aspartic protease (TIGR02281 family)
MRHSIVIGLAVLLLAAPAAGEIYRWVDEQGRMHFAQALHDVPERYRAQAESKALSPTGPSPVQTYSPPAAMTRPRPRRASAPTFGHVGGGVYEVPVERAGSRLLVQVTINDTIDVPFYIDTGASRVLIPSWAVDRAGIDTEGAGTMIAGTANGLIEVPVVTIESVELHGARVEDVPAAVSDSMQIGLLGLSFLNHFEYSVDPTQGIVRLRENDLGARGAIPGAID